VSKLYSIWSKPRLWIFGRTKGNTVYVRVAYLKNGGITEYTLFSHQHLKKEEKENEIKQYIENWITNYEIVEKKSKAASDDVSFWKANTKTCHLIGTSGGWTKRVQVTLSKF
jgi:lycopene beta-cyclase